MAQQINKNLLTSTIYNGGHEHHFSKMFQLIIESDKYGGMTVCDLIAGFGTLDVFSM
jgi:hypothetical protein